MIFYKIALKGLFLELLTYHSDEEIGLFCEVEVYLRTKKITGFVIRKCDKPLFKTSKIIKTTNRSLSTTQQELAKFISSYYNCALGFVLGFFEPCESYDLQAKCLINEPKLSKDQLLAKDFLQKNSTSLLFANTGSGKSEIYFTFIKEMLNNGKQVLLLMPEISLTPQMSKRLEIYFKDSFILWHSKISKAKKQKAMNEFLSGKAMLVAGARSSLFLPFVKLGLIIVDEEHDNSYKASNNPKINAKDLALFLGNKLHIRVILGSATPLASTFYKQKYYRLKKSFYPAKKEFIYDESDELISPLLIKHIQENHENKKQAIIFLPTRANYRLLLCRGCGGSVLCPFCDIAMSLHKKSNLLRCHYCNFAQSIPTTCPACKQSMFEAKKIGTAELVLRLEGILPKIRFHKFDSDEFSTFNKLTKVLNDFNKHKIDVLVGTSMLAKGHDYADVGLSIILGLDEYLFHANYKAREETLALAIQVAGRAGRKGFAKVLLQTKHKAFFENFINDYDSFLQDELIVREGLYPPFKRLLRVIIKDSHEESAKFKTKVLKEELKKLKGLEIVGFGACVLAKIANNFRYYILLRSSTHTPLLQASRICNKYAGVETDIDPVNFS